MPEITQQDYKRRASDRQGTDPSLISELLLDIKFEVLAIRTELTEFKKDVNKAFPKDEEGAPDYVSHRRYHDKEIKEADKIDDYKTDVTKKILGWLSIGTLGLLLGGLTQYFRNGG